MLKSIYISATTLPDAWFQALYNATTHGRDFKIDKGSFAGQIRMELDWVDIHIKQPGLRCADGLPLVPEMPEGLKNMPAPTTKKYVSDYSRYILTADKEPGESYTYGERLTRYPLEGDKLNGWLLGDEKIFDLKPLGKYLTLENGIYYVNQIEWMIDTYKKHGHRNNQMILQVGHPTDCILKDPPCLRHIDTRIQDGQLHLFPYFRSWDLWVDYLPM